MSSVFYNIIIKKSTRTYNRKMKIRKKEYGDCNIVGRNIERIRKKQKISQKDFISQLQLYGLDINPTSYSKLEGQIRIATDKEVFAISKVLDVKIEDLFNNTDN